MAVRFDQNSDLISYSSSVFNPATDGFTMTAWTLVSVDQNTFQTMARLYAGSSTVATLSTRSDGTTGPTYYTVSGSIEGTGSFTLLEWRKVAWTCSGTNGKAYFSVPDGATQVFSGSVSSNSLVDGITLGGRAPNDLSEGLNGPLVITVQTHKATEAVVTELGDVLRTHRGKSEVRLHLQGDSRVEIMGLPVHLRVNPSPSLFGDLKVLLGPTCLDN